MIDLLNPHLDEATQVMQELQAKQTMIERVARAIAITCHPTRAQCPDYWEAWVSDSDKDSFRAEARAAVGAMREPTEGMVTGTWARDEDAKRIWGEMIDAALEE